MAPSVEEIAKTLDIMRKEDERNVEKFDRILTNINEKLEFMNSDNESVEMIKMYLTELKNIVNSDFNSTEEKFNNVETKLDKSLDISSHIKDLSENLKEYITELNEASRTLEVEGANNISEKLTDLEEVIVHSSENYEQNLQVLDGKISEFSTTIEGIKNLTDDKISASLGEINDVRAELEAVRDYLVNVKNSADENSASSIQTFEDGVERIISEIAQISEKSFQANNEVLNAELAKIEEKFDALLSSLIDAQTKWKDNLKEDLATNEVNFTEKLTNLKQEVELVNTDIVDILQNKSDEILQAFEPIKISIDALKEIGLNDLIEKIKLELETSFLNFSVDINGELATTSEAVSRLEQAYKETFNKIEVIENCVSEKLHEKLELVNVTIENNARDVKDFFEQELEEYSKNLSEFVEENNVKVVDSVDNLKTEISARLDDFNEGQKEITEQNNVISANISTLGDNLKNYVQSACENTIEKYSPLETKTSREALRDKINEFVAMSKVESANSQIALDELDKNLNQNLTEISDSNQDVSQMISSLHDKIDVMVADSSFDELNDRLDEVSETEDKVSEMISALNEKVDIIAMDTSDFDIIDEISDIKDLIFEQRKYFESAPDEKAVEIDKYLKDVLTKLENVD